MAGILVAGVPLLAGIPGGIVLQVSMRFLDLGLQARLTTELALITAGCLGLRYGCNNISFQPEMRGVRAMMIYIFIAATGVFAMGDGILYSFSRWMQGRPTF